MQPAITRMTEMLLLAAELALATLLFLRQLEPRRRWLGRAAVSLIDLAGVALLLAYLKNYLMSFVDTSGFSAYFFAISYLLSMASELIIFALFNVSIHFVFRTSIFHALFIGCAAYATRNIARCALCLWLKAFGPVPTFSPVLLRNGYGALTYLLVYLVIYAVCYIVFFWHYQSGDEDFLDHKILGVLIALVVMNTLLSAVNAPKESSQAAALYTFVILSRIWTTISSAWMCF